MFKTNASMSARQVGPGVAVIDIRGEVSSLAENTLMDAYTQANALGAETIILNFSGMEYMNSSGIGLMVTLLIRAQRQKQRLLICGLNDHYRQIFALTRLEEAITICSSEMEALRAAGLS
jgi:anti-anti-sigma factor